MKLLFGFGTNKYAKGGIISFYDKDNEHLLGSASRYIDKDVLKKIVFKEIIEYKNYIGNFGWKESKHEGYLYKLDENDQDLVKDVKKKEGEIIFRYVTYATAIGGMTPLIKINLDNGMLYFLENWGDDKIVFSTKGVKAIYINIIEYKLKN